MSKGPYPILPVALPLIPRGNFASWRLRSGINEGAQVVPDTLRAPLRWSHHWELDGSITIMIYEDA